MKYKVSNGSIVFYALVQFSIIIFALYAGYATGAAVAFITILCFFSDIFDIIENSFKKFTKEVIIYRIHNENN